MEFEPDLRMSPAPIIAALGGLGMVFLVLGELVLSSAEHSSAMNLCLLSYGTCGIALTLCSQKPQLGRWSSVLGLLAVTYAGNAWLPVPGLATLLCVPVASAAALIGLSGALAIAVTATALLLLTPAGVAGNSSGTTIAALSGIWAILGIMFAIDNPVRQLAGWARSYYARADGLLQEARDRRAELEQAMEDLAHANLQLTRLNALTQGLRQAAEDARTAKEQFVANVSHELRTPLNMVVGFTEMIMQAPKAYGGPLPTGLLADLSVIHRNARHLADLIDDVLDLSQIESGQMALVKEHVAFQEIVEASAEAVRPLFKSKNLYLETDIEESLPTIFCDRTRIREVMLNLLSNAGRFTERGGVRVRAWQDCSDLLVSVVDTGRGIAVKDLGRLFQPFQQADGSIRRLYGGTGLGLSISRRFVEMHEGKIWAESQEGVGTTFFIRLPLEPAGPAPEGAGSAYWRGLQPGWEYLQRTRPSAAPKISLRPRLVVLEPGDVLQRLLRRYLQDVEIAASHNLEDAVKALADQSSDAFLINDLSIGSALPRVQSAAIPDGVPTIICSVPDLTESAEIMGVAGYLIKPIARQTLLDVLSRLNLPGNTILVVDDEPEALQLFRRLLASAAPGYRVLRARDGQEGLRILRDQRPDAVLLDLVMPGMDGFRLLEAKSQDPELREIPVIICSAQDPAGHPVVSDAVLITRSGGLSAPPLLACIKAIMEILSAGSAGRGLPATPLG
jgi:signal transduction histidine kinase/CheY-like chemotaxis protein